MAGLKNILALSILVLALAPTSFAQSASLSGAINGVDGPLPGANIRLLPDGPVTVAGEEGKFSFSELKAGEYEVQISFVGYRPLREKVILRAGEQREVDWKLREDILGLEAAVVTATRSAIPRHRSPVIINRLDDRLFERTQALSLSEGLSFSPGLRMENNCQNCGFTQLRMNGLDGPYAQILINSRPIFSALTGVYGLDMIPTNMIDRVEVVRGGGSALYGGNAIAGTVNIITKDPVSNFFEVGSNLAYIKGEAPDRSLTLNGSIVSDDLSKGLTFYAFNRERQPWDANGDGFSEITQLRNTSFGADAFFKPDDYSKIKLNLFSIQEFRRGGNDFDLEPHQSDITEQLDHNILGGGLSYERYSRDRRQKLSAYISLQHTGRDSYYGGGGRVLQPGDQLTEDDLIALNAYGESTDLALVGGLQYAHELSEQWTLTLGSEYTYNDVLDEMPGYGRAIDQRVGVLGNYAQLQWAPDERWSFLLGGRFDHIRVDGLYALEVESFEQENTFNIFVPRLTALHHLTDDFKLRLAYAQGYRAPQAFDEDLHIETVGGAARFTRLSEDLVTERSHSLSASLDYSLSRGRTEANFVLDGFYTILNNPFITADQQELPSGIAVVTKRNGSGATVAGLNAEVNLALSRELVFQLGATVQQAQYEEREEIWAPADLNDANRDSMVTTDRLLRTPEVYGFFTATWSPLKKLDLSLSGVYTGAMDAPHVIDPGNEYTIIERTPDFLELNLKLAYELDISEQFDLHFYGGVQNLFNSFQQDFDLGPERDAGYVYGPVRPRTVFVGLKFHFE